ncbi:Na+/H+ antiporter subunit E [Hydrogenophaga sp. YM1]|jgi:multicomponent Na+:H+ antiporter subunit E|uniref:Na+/H+ antiporter subunit E n=1 Tax=unclassified Hydrogenophaga TaxID=2610897 RepID=UPI000878B8F3|nr:MULTISPECIES: Na+/H+ antiporter subunit E [unclassified Hydrogenophaga]QRR34415.1 Na+/H+ antiporter subunit E [Hydrogenophaga sp. YM1]
MKPLLRRARAWLVLAGLFARELTLSVHDVLRAVLRPSRVQRSGIVAVPLSLQGDTAIALLANLVTLTPGTTSLHLSEDRGVLYVHAMNLSDETVAQIQSGFERRVKECLE